MICWSVKAEFRLFEGRLREGRLYIQCTYVYKLCILYSVVSFLPVLLKNENLSYISIEIQEWGLNLNRDKTKILIFNKYLESTIITAAILYIEENAVSLLFLKKCNIIFFTDMIKLPWVQQM